MNDPKRIVLDANILLRAVFGVRVRCLLKPTVIRCLFARLMSASRKLVKPFLIFLQDEGLIRCR